jgi:hypothetical protein
MAPRTVALQQGGRGRVKQDDLAPFAVAEGLLARIAAERPGKLTEVEHRHLLDMARENLARETGETLEMAGKAIFRAADEGEFTLQCGDQFATVTVYGPHPGRVHPGRAGRQVSSRAQLAR